MPYGVDWISMELADANLKVLSDYFLARREAFVSFTRALVEAESPSGDEAGSKAVVSLLASAAEAINVITKIERIASENYGEHLRVKAFGVALRLLFWWYDR